MKICPKCKSEFESGKFCPECGVALEEKKEEIKLVCIGCGAELLPEAKFCPECGEKVEKLKDLSDSKISNYNDVDNLLSEAEKLDNQAWEMVENDESESETQNLFEKSFDLYLQAANLGSAKAQYEVGNAYYLGVGLKNETDDKSAFKWFKKAADQNHPTASAMVGLFYLNGMSGVVPQSNEQGYRYISNAANQEDEKGLLYLAQCYHFGLAVSKNLTEAEKLYRQLLSKNEDSYQAKYGIGRIFFDREEYSSAFAYFIKAADFDDDAKFYLGLCYEQGLGIEQNIAKAVEQYKKIENDKEGWTQYRLGLIYFTEDNGFTSPKEAYRMFKLSSSCGNPNGTFYMGICRKYGIGVEENFEKGQELIAKAMDAGVEGAEEEYNNSKKGNSGIFKKIGMGLLGGVGLGLLGGLFS